jgi:predicted MPP superfamily phosphohydrolase
LVVTEYKIKADIEKSARFAFVSDIHDRPNGPIIKAIRGIRPDAVLVGGDFIHNNELYERGFEFLRLSAKLWPTFCSIGNHEMKYVKGDITEKVNASGAVLLDDRAYRYNGITIGGLTTGYTEKGRQSHFEKTPAPNLEFLSEFASLRGFKILLSHHPEYYPRYIKDTSIELTLSGHAHGGQWCFFGRGVYAPGQGLFPKYTHGMHDGKFIVSRGLSIENPVPRINNKPEIIVIQLEPKN